MLRRAMRRGKRLRGEDDDRTEEAWGRDVRSSGQVEGDRK